MDSRLEKLAIIKGELEKSLSDSTNDKLTDNLHKIFRRVHEASRLIIDKKDVTGRVLSTKLIGHYILKTYRMTREPVFNKILGKYTPDQGQHLTVVFQDLDKIAQDILGFDYKKFRRAEADVRRAHPFLVKGENAFRLSAHNETDPDIKKFLDKTADDIHVLVAMIYLGKNPDQGLCKQTEIMEKVTRLWEKISDKNWDEYISNPSKNPTAPLCQFNERYEEMMENYLVKKFSAQRSSSGGKTTERSGKMEEDAVHLEFDPSRRKSSLSKKRIGGVGGIRRTGSGPTLARGRFSRPGEPLHRPGADQDESRPEEDEIDTDQEFEDDEDLENEAFNPAELDDDENDLPVAPAGEMTKPASSSIPENLEESSGLYRQRARMSTPYGAMADDSSMPEPSIPGATLSPRGETREKSDFADTDPSQRNMAPKIGGARKGSLGARTGVKGSLGREFFRTADKTEPEDETTKKPKSFEEELMDLVDRSKVDKGKGRGTQELSPADAEKSPRTFLSQSIEDDAPADEDQEESKPHSFLSSTESQSTGPSFLAQQISIRKAKSKIQPPALKSSKPKLAKDFKNQEMPPIMFEHNVGTEMLPPLESFFGDMKEEEETPESEAQPVSGEPVPEEIPAEETRSEKVDVVELVRKRDARKAKTGGIMGFFKKMWESFTSVFKGKKDEFEDDDW